MTDRGFLTRTPFAHRGLHGGGIVENTRAAFEAAIAAGHGIETDVQASRDGLAMVCHDYELDRLAGRPGRLADFAASELEAMAITGCDETIPRLETILALVGGRVPLLIEVKARDRRVGEFCRAIAAALAGYAGAAAVMSFNPEVGRWFARHAPATARGLVVTEQGEKGVAGRLTGSMQRSLSVLRARPDFLAYDIRDLPSAFAGALRRRGLPLLTWTVRTEEQRATAAAHADQIIYEALP